MEERLAKYTKAFEFAQEHDLLRFEDKHYAYKSPLKLARYEKGGAFSGGVLAYLAVGHSPRFSPIIQVGIIAGGGVLGYAFGHYGFRAYMKQRIKGMKTPLAAYTRSIIGFSPLPEDQDLLKPFENFTPQISQTSQIQNE